MARLPQCERAAGESGPFLMAALTNLLPLAVTTLKQEAGSAYIEEDMPPIPQKLTAKMLRWEYVEMGELLPEFLAQ